MSSKNKTLGILGGMGPEATSLFFQRIITMTDAEKDQDHLKMIIYNDPEIPDRTEAIMKNGENPVSIALRGIGLLEKMEVDFIAIPCVTMHFFFNEIEMHTKIPILNIIEETALYIKTQYPDSRKIGILATEGTYHCRIFEKVYSENDLETIVPDEKGKSDLMESIYGNKGVKAGFNKDYCKGLIMHVSDNLLKKGADVIVGGCTEIPIAVGQEDFKVPFVDSLSVLAMASIKKAGAKPRYQINL